jgi:hypothetical protein
MGQRPPRSPTCRTRIPAGRGAAQAADLSLRGIGAGGSECAGGTEVRRGRPRARVTTLVVCLILLASGVSVLVASGVVSRDLGGPPSLCSGLLVACAALLSLSWLVPAMGGAPRDPNGSVVSEWLRRPGGSGWPSTSPGRPKRRSDLFGIVAHQGSPPVHVGARPLRLGLPHPWQRARALQELAGPVRTPRPDGGEDGEVGGDELGGLVGPGSGHGVVVDQRLSRSAESQLEEAAGADSQRWWMDEAMHSVGIEDLAGKIFGC